MQDEKPIGDLLAELRHQASIGNGWASIHASDIERLANEIKGQRAEIDKLEERQSQMDYYPD